VESYRGAADSRLLRAIGLDELLEPLSRCLDTESAERVIGLRVAAPVQERIDLLGERANQGPSRSGPKVLQNLGSGSV
jgi:hypothetical protein